VTLHSAEVFQRGYSEQGAVGWWLKTTAVVPTGQQVTFSALKRTGLQAGMAIAWHSVQQERIGAA
jgi:hypothetical protein